MPVANLVAGMVPRKERIGTPAWSVRPSSLWRVSSPDERREGLKALFHEARGCVRCPQLAQTRHTVVFGAGHADADLMFVGEAPGRSEDEQGLPFVGQAGRLLDTLLGEIGLSRDAVFVTNVLRCRPPGNRDPHPVEIERCQDYLFRTIDLVQPTVICTLGNFATKLLRHDTTGIMRLHGQAEVRTVGPRAVRLFPVFHPAAALYTPSNVDVLRQDFQRLPALLALGPPEQPPPVVEEPLVDVDGGEPARAADGVPGERPEREKRERDGEALGDGGGPEAEPPAVQLGLF
ncbi:MAG: uracil-DNA glycosylase [Baekduia sp.]|nr:uracil-DNA glycosylase [Baekduia sp.]